MRKNSEIKGKDIWKVNLCEEREMDWWRWMTTTKMTLLKI
jgi:hypothetical protein